MKIRIGFNGSFGGLLYSSGYSYDPDCVYINGTGRDYYEFYIQLNRCGTLGKNSRQEDARKNPAVSFSGTTIRYCRSYKTASYEPPRRKRKRLVERVHVIACRWVWGRAFFLSSKSLFCTISHEPPVNKINVQLVRDIITHVC